MPKIAHPDTRTARPQDAAGEPASRIPTDREIRAAVARGRRLQARAIANLFASFGK
jgi:hypothetical protein